MTRGDAPIIMVTGANGQIGFELVRALQGLGRVIGLNRRACDLSDLGMVRDTVRALKPTLIINAAAYTDVDRAESEPGLAFRVNGEAPGVMAEEARRIGAVLIHYSTDYVFDGTKTGAYVEEDAPCPINEYGLSKFGGERALQQVGGAYLILRTTWIYGSRRKNFLTAVRGKLAAGESLRIVTDQIGAPTWCRTVASMTAHMVASRGMAGAGASALDGRSLGPIYHLSAFGVASRYTFAREICQLGGAEVLGSGIAPVTTDALHLAACRPLNCKLSVERLRRDFGLFAVDWRDALRMCLGDMDGKASI